MAITIIGNVGNVGYAIPMVSAVPTDVNLAYMLAWNPAAQALDYVAYTGNALGDFGVTRDLAVTRNLTVGGNSVLGDAVTDTVSIPGILTTTSAAPAVIPNVTGSLSTTGSLISTSGGSSALTGTQLSFTGTKVLGVRQTGWANLTGTPLKTTFATGSITLPQLAGIVMALQTDLTTHGIIGA